VPPVKPLRLRSRVNSAPEVPRKSTPEAVPEEVKGPRRRALSISGVPSQVSRGSTGKANSNIVPGKMGKQWFKRSNARAVLKHLYENGKKSTTTPPWFLGIDTRHEEKALEKWMMVILQYGPEDIQMVVDYASVFLRQDMSEHLNGVVLDSCKSRPTKDGEIVLCGEEKFSNDLDIEETAFFQAKSRLAKEMKMLYDFHTPGIDPLGEWIDNKWDDNILSTVHYSLSLTSPIERVRVQIQTVENLKYIHEASITLLELYWDYYEDTFNGESISDIMKRLDHIMEIIEKEQDDENTERQLYRMMAYYVKGHLTVRYIVEFMYLYEEENDLWYKFREWLNDDENDARLEDLVNFYLMKDMLTIASVDGGFKGGKKGSFHSRKVDVGFGKRLF